MISRPQDLAARTHHRRPSKSASLRHEQSFPTPKNARGNNKDRQREEYEPLDAAEDVQGQGPQGSFFDFPSVDTRQPRPRYGGVEGAAQKQQQQQQQRSRARSGPSNHSHSLTSRGSGDPASHYSYPLRDSNSSTLSHLEDAPQTPVDDSFFRDPIFGGAPVVVAAPVAGVETMDALVDGMNGFGGGGDDHFMGLSSMSARTSKAFKAGFHPLYQPPLPKPPPGVKLGGALPRKQSVRSRDSDADEDEEDVAPRARSPPPPRPRRAQSRTTSSSSRPPTSPEAKEFPRIPSPQLQKTVAPSISEIIRAHAPLEQQARSRKTSYATSNGHDSIAPSTYSRLRSPEPEPEPRPAVSGASAGGAAGTAGEEEDGDMVSRSSVDTLAEEIQRTIQLQKRASLVPRTVHKARSFQQHPHSAPDLVRSVSSPRSDTRRESSIYSNSTTISEQPPLPPLDLMGLTKVQVNSPSQTIAQYLRSTRLTTLLRLTRSPHGSRGNPLTVSLSDLGSPTGFPVVVFLGLGCVRHIMGLYDEMAECMGIRLITIDRCVSFPIRGPLHKYSSAAQLGFGPHGRPEVEVREGHPGMGVGGRGGPGPAQHRAVQHHGALSGSPICDGLRE